MVMMIFTPVCLPYKAADGSDDDDDYDDDDGDDDGLSPVRLPYEAADGLPHAWLVELDVLLKLAGRNLVVQNFIFFLLLLTSDLILYFFNKTWKFWLFWP